MKQNFGVRMCRNKERVANSTASRQDFLKTFGARMRSNKKRKASTIARNKAGALPKTKTYICIRCGERKAKKFFPLIGNVHRGNLRWCKTCKDKYHRDWARKKIISLREKVFGKLGKVCKRCGFSDKRALQIDHVNGRGLEDYHRNMQFYVRVLADKSGQYQILCANCNWIKRHEKQEFPRRID